MSKYFFDHIHLFGPDPLQMVEFYEKMFGAEKVGEQDFGGGRYAYKLDLNGTEILISKSNDAMPAGLAHFGIRVDNLTKAVEELKAKGIKFTVEPRVVKPGLTVSMLQATENVRIELQEGGI